MNNLKVTSLDLYFDSHPDTILQYELSIAGVDHAQLHAGARDDRTAKEIKAELEALLESKLDVPFLDLWGNSTRVRILGVTEQPYKQTEEIPSYGQGRRIETVLGVSLLDVTWPPP